MRCENCNEERSTFPRTSAPWNGRGEPPMMVCRDCRDVLEIEDLQLEILDLKTKFLLSRGWVQRELSGTTLWHKVVQDTTYAVEIDTAMDLEQELHSL